MHTNYGLTHGGQMDDRLWCCPITTMVMVGVKSHVAAQGHNDT